MEPGGDQLDRRKRPGRRRPTVEGQVSDTGGPKASRLGGSAAFGSGAGAGARDDGEIGFDGLSEYCTEMQYDADRVSFRVYQGAPALLDASQAQQSHCCGAGPQPC